MRPSNHPGHVLPQDTAPEDGNEEVTTSQPVSLSEVDDLLYGEDRPADLRLDRLRELADGMRARAAGDILDNDADGTLREIERAITTLEATGRDAQPGMVFDDPLDHRETLAPDSDELDEIEEGDEESIEDDIGDGVWAADDEDDDEDEDEDEDDEDDEDDDREGDIDPPRADRRR